MFSLNHHKDVPLDRDPSARYLPWLIAFMVYLAVLAIVATAVIQSIGNRWERGVSNTLTIQIPPVRSVQEDQNRIANALEILRATPAVLLAEPMAKADVLALLEPWLGTADALADMPLPHLISVSLRTDAPLDTQIMVEQLNLVASGVTIDDHRIWLQRLIDMSNSLTIGAYLILIMIAIAAIATVYFVTRTGLAIHHEVIEVLHLIGAQDSYIARQFAENALHLGVRGGMIGLAVAGPSIGLFAYLYRQVDTTLLPQIDITLFQWILVFALPVLAAAMGYFTARSTVMKTLKKMV